MIRKIKKIGLEEKPVLHEEENEGSPLVDQALLEEEEKEESVEKRIVYVVLGALVILGVVTGFALSRIKSVPGSSQTGQSASGKKVTGATDTTAFKDWAEGTLDVGGISGEGSHHLTRDGGPSQTVYLISSTVDLNEFVGKKVKVWGATMAAKKAAWLMDVGKVETE